MPNYLSVKIFFLLFLISQKKVPDGKFYAVHFIDFLFQVVCYYKFHHFLYIFSNIVEGLQSHFICVALPYYLFHFRKLKFCIILLVWMDLSFVLDLYSLPCALACLSRGFSSLSHLLPIFFIFSFYACTFSLSASDSFRASSNICFSVSTC